MKILSKYFIAVIVGLLAAPAFSAELSDAQIADYLKVGGMGHVQLAKLAEKMAQNAAVKAFAEKAVVACTKDQEQMVKLLNEQNIKPTLSTDSVKLKAEFTKRLLVLKVKKQSEFDRAYIADEIDGGQMAMSDFDKVLIPNVKNAELKTYLIMVRAEIEASVKEAQLLQSQLH